MSVHYRRGCQRRGWAKCGVCNLDMMSEVLELHVEAFHPEKLACFCRSPRGSPEKHGFALCLKRQLERDEKLLQLEVARLQIQSHRVGVTR